jgi:hypothetical protein
LAHFAGDKFEKGLKWEERWCTERFWQHVVVESNFIIYRRHTTKGDRISLIIFYQ